LLKDLINITSTFCYLGGAFLLYDSTFGVPKVEKSEIRISKSETTAPTVFKVGAGHGKFEFSNVQMTKTGLIQSIFSD
jgi:hypothetical protein